MVAGRGTIRNPICVHLTVKLRAVCSGVELKRKIMHSLSARVLGKFVVSADFTES